VTICGYGFAMLNASFVRERVTSDVGRGGKDYSSTQWSAAG
jgi:hypothetical protein